MVTGNLVGARRGCGSRAWFHFSVAGWLGQSNLSIWKLLGVSGSRTPSPSPHVVVAVNQH